MGQFAIELVVAFFDGLLKFAKALAADLAAEVEAMDADLLHYAAPGSREWATFWRREIFIAKSTVIFFEAEQVANHPGAKAAASNRFRADSMPDSRGML